MSSDTPIQRRVFSERLWLAIKRQGLTYEQTARRAREHLPPGAKLSSVTVWSYAKGRSTPRRMSYVEALGKALGVDPDELMGEQLRSNGAVNNQNAASPDADAQRQQPEEEPLPSIHVADLGGGRAFLHIHEIVDWPLALEILQRLKGDMIERPSDESAEDQPVAAESQETDADGDDEERD